MFIVTLFNKVSQTWAVTPQIKLLVQPLSESRNKQNKNIKAIVAQDICASCFQVERKYREDLSEISVLSFCLNHLLIKIKQFVCI
jgi:hypothetical protein